MNEFKDFLNPEIADAVGFARPTAVQRGAMKYILEGHDVFNQALSGSGRTLASIMCVLQMTDTSLCDVSALVLCRDVKRVYDRYKFVSRHMNKIKIFAVGIEPKHTEKRYFSQRLPNIVVGHPARVQALIQDRVFNLDLVQQFVIHAADEFFMDSVRKDLAYRLFKRAMSGTQVIIDSATADDRLKHTHIVPLMTSKARMKIITDAEHKQEAMRGVKERPSTTASESDRKTVTRKKADITLRSELSYAFDPNTATHAQSEIIKRIQNGLDVICTKEPGDLTTAAIAVGILDGIKPKRFETHAIMLTLDPSADYDIYSKYNTTIKFAKCAFFGVKALGIEERRYKVGSWPLVLSTTERLSAMVFGKTINLNKLRIVVIHDCHILLNTKKSPKTVGLILKLFAHMPDRSKVQVIMTCGKDRFDPELVKECETYLKKGRLFSMVPEIKGSVKMTTPEPESSTSNKDKQSSDHLPSNRAKDSKKNATDSTPVTQNVGQTAPKPLPAAGQKGSSQKDNGSKSVPLKKESAPKPSKLVTRVDTPAQDKPKTIFKPRVIQTKNKAAAATSEKAPVPTPASAPATTSAPAKASAPAPTSTPAKASAPAPTSIPAKASAPAPTSAPTRASTPAPTSALTKAPAPAPTPVPTRASAPAPVSKSNPPPVSAHAKSSLVPYDFPIYDDAESDTKQQKIEDTTKQEPAKPVPVKAHTSASKPSSTDSQKKGFRQWLDDDILKTITFNNPRRVQSALIPEIIEHKSIIHQSEIGCGKTTATILGSLQNSLRSERPSIIALCVDGLSTTASLYRRYSRNVGSRVLILQQHMSSDQMRKMRLNDFRVIIGHPNMVAALLEAQQGEPLSVVALNLHRCFTLVTEDKSELVQAVRFISKNLKVKQVLIESSTISVHLLKLYKRLFPQHKFNVSSIDNAIMERAQRMEAAEAQAVQADLKRAAKGEQDQDNKPKRIRLDEYGEEVWDNVPMSGQGTLKGEPVDAGVTLKEEEADAGGAGPEERSLEDVKAEEGDEEEAEHPHDPEYMEEGHESGLNENESMEEDQPPEDMGDPWDLGAEWKCELATALAEFKSPSQVQRELVPLILEGYDILCQSPRGQYTTTGIILGIMQLLEPDAPGASVLFLCTGIDEVREVEETFKHLDSYIHGVGVTSVGMNSFDFERRELQMNGISPIVIGTPGVLYRLMKSGCLYLGQTKFFVIHHSDFFLDSADFCQQLYELYEHTHPERQVLLEASLDLTQIRPLCRTFLSGGVLTSQWMLLDKGNRARITVAEPLEDVMACFGDD